MADRGPLRFIVLALTGQDVNRCLGCECCSVDEQVQARFDLSVNQVLAAARENDPRALTNQTIWVLAEASPAEVGCANRLDIVTVARALCREAERRGLAPRQVGEGVSFETQNAKRETKA
jgi:heterodisulfide reductase subunit C